MFLGGPWHSNPGQAREGYDGASNMSSNRAGVQACIWQHGQPMSTAVGIAVNMVISHSCAPYLKFVTFYMSSRIDACFSTTAPKELVFLSWRWQLVCQRWPNGKLDLCRTHWALRHKAYQHFYEAYTFIVEALEMIDHGSHAQKQHPGWYTICPVQSKHSNAIPGACDEWLGWPVLSTGSHCFFSPSGSTLCDLQPGDGPHYNTWPLYIWPRPAITWMCHSGTCMLEAAISAEVRRGTSCHLRSSHQAVQTNALSKQKDLVLACLHHSSDIDIMQMWA